MTKEPVEDASFVADLCRTCTLIAGALGVFIYVQILRNRRYWVLMEAALGVLEVVALPFCSYLLPRAWGIEDDTHHSMTFLLRLQLLGFISIAFVVYMTRESTDPTVGLSVSVSNILTRTMLLLCLVNELCDTKPFSKWVDHTKTDAVCIGLLLIGDIFHLSKVTTNEGSRTVGDPVSFHLSIDALFSFFLGALIFGFPDMFIHILTGSKSPSGGQIFFSKEFGASLLGGSVLSFASLCYRNENDAVTTLQSKMIIHLPVLLFSLTNALVDPFFRTWSHFSLLVVFAALAYNAGVAAWNHEKKKRE